MSNESGRPFLFVPAADNFSRLKFASATAFVFLAARGLFSVSRRCSFLVSGEASHSEVAALEQSSVDV